MRYLIEDLRDDILKLRRAQLQDRRLITATEAIEDLAALTLRPPIPPIPDPPPLNNSGGTLARYVCANQIPDDV